MCTNSLRSSLFACKLFLAVFAGPGTSCNAFIAHWNAPKFYHQLRNRNSRSFLKATAGGFTIALVLHVICMITGFLTLLSCVKQGFEHHQVLIAHTVAKRVVHLLEAGYNTSSSFDLKHCSGLVRIARATFCTTILLTTTGQQCHVVPCSLRRSLDFLSISQATV